MRFERISKGHKRYSVKAFFLAYWMKTFKNTTVSVPGVVTNTLFMYDFEQQVKKNSDFQELDADRLKKLAVFLTMNLEKLNSKELVDLLKEAGLGEDVKKYFLHESADEAKSKSDLQGVLKRLTDGLVDSIGKAGIPGILMASVLSEGTVSSNLKEISFDYNAIVTSMRGLTARYQDVVRNPDIQLQNVEFSNMVQEHAPLKFIHTIKTTMKQGEGPSVPARMSYVIDEIFKTATGSTIVKERSILPGILYEVEEVSLANKVTYASTVTAYWIALRTIMGFSSGSTVESEKIQDIANSMLTGLAKRIPVLPSELANDSTTRAQAEGLLHEMWTLFAIKRILERTPSEFSNAMQSLFNMQKTFNMEHLKPMLLDFIDTLGICFGAYQDAAAFCYSVFTNEEIYFDDVHPVRRKKINKVLNEFASSFNDSTEGMIEPRWPLQGRHIVGHAIVVDKSEVEDILPDRIEKNIHSYFKNPLGSARVEMIRNLHISGSLIDMPMEGVSPYNLSNFDAFRPFYGVSIQNPSFILDYPVFTRVLGLFKYADLFTKTSIANHLASGAGTAVYIQSSFDLAKEFSIPIEMAEQLYQQPDFWFKFSNINNALFIWDHKLAPMYEIAYKEDDREIPPVVTLYPFMLSREYDFGDGSLQDPVTIKKSETSKKTTSSKSKKKKKDDDDVDPDDVDPASPSSKKIVTPKVDDIEDPSQIDK